MCGTWPNRSPDDRTSMTKKPSLGCRLTRQCIAVVSRGRNTAVLNNRYHFSSGVTRKRTQPPAKDYTRQGSSYSKDSGPNTEGGQKKDLKSLKIRSVNWRLLDAGGVRQDHIGVTGEGAAGTWGGTQSTRGRPSPSRTGFGTWVEHTLRTARERRAESFSIKNEMRVCLRQPGADNDAREKADGKERHTCGRCLQVGVFERTAGRGRCGWESAIPGGEATCRGKLRPNNELHYNETGGKGVPRQQKNGMSFLRAPSAGGTRTRHGPKRCGQTRGAGDSAAQGKTPPRKARRP